MLEVNGVIIHLLPFAVLPSCFQGPLIPPQAEIQFKILQCAIFVIGRNIRPWIELRTEESSSLCTYIIF